MQDLATILVIAMILLCVVVLYNQFKIMKKISKVESLGNDKKVEEDNNLYKDDVKEQNPLVAAAIIAAINQHRNKRG